MASFGRHIISGAAVVLGSIFLFAGCGRRDMTLKPASQGAPYEIVVVAGHEVWDGAPGDSLRAALHRRFPNINREEPYFKTLRVLPHDFEKLIARHRNVLVMEVKPTSEGRTNSDISITRDRFAKGQLAISASASDMALLARLITDKREDIMLAFETAEKDRDVAAATEHTPKQIAEKIRAKFGFELSTGPGYTIRAESEDFLWMSYEMPTSSQGIIVYTYPFSGIKDFERASLIARRDEFVARVPGENPGSHMITVEEVNELLYKKINDRRWAEMSGLWDVKGDFMGGPYRNYSTIDTTNQRVIAIDFYVYSPETRLSQRNYIKQLEHLVHTAKIAGE